MIRSGWIASLSFLLLSSGQATAQVQSSALATDENSPSEIQRIVAEATAAGPQSDQFQQLLDRAIEITSKRTLTANSHSPWQIFHCILALRTDTVLRLGDKKVNAIEWLSTAEPQFDNQPWMLLTNHGAKFHSYTRIYAFEGHPSQFLALLSHSNLPLDHQFHVQGKIVTLNDVINNTMKEVNAQEEVTWVLWALQHYLKPDAVWTNQLNETWSIERLVQIETTHPVVGAPCGGNHRLYALTRARDKYLQSGNRLRGVWFQADQRIKQHIEIARSLQNSDGSFSSESYKGPGYTPDVNKRFNTTGHTMEFLSAALPAERLNEPWVRNAVWMLSRELIIHRDTKIDCGPLFHSLNALILYRDRIRPRDDASQDSFRPAPLPREARLPRTDVSFNLDPSQEIPNLNIVPEPAGNGRDSNQTIGRTPAIRLPVEILDPPSTMTAEGDEPRLEIPTPVSTVAAAPDSLAPESNPTHSANGTTIEWQPRGDSQKSAVKPRATASKKSSPPLWVARRTVSAPQPLSTEQMEPPLQSFELPILQPDLLLNSPELKAPAETNDCGTTRISYKLPPIPVEVTDEDEPASAIYPVNK